MLHLGYVTSILSTLGITAAAAAGAAYLVFRTLGDKWLTSKFNQTLEAFKHAQQQELEQLRLRINTTFDRTVKLHSNEFEVLPELWARLNDAFHYVSGFTSLGQEYADLDRYSDPELEHFLAESGLPEYQKDELRATDEKTAHYQRLRFWQSLEKVTGKYREFSRYLNVKSIFIQPVLREPIEELSDLMWSALCEKEHEERYPDPRKGRWEQGEALRKKGPLLRANIGETIQERLWSSAVVSSSGVSSREETTL